MPTVAQVERGSLTISSGDGTSSTISLSGTFTIADSVVMFTCKGGDINDWRPARHAFAMELTGTQEITWTRGVSGFAADVTIHWEVVEFDSGELENLVTGYSTSITDANSGPHDITISSLTAYANAMVIQHPYFTLVPAPPSQTHMTGILTSNTNLQLTADADSAASELNAFYQIVEFKSSDLDSSETGVITIAGTAQSNTATLSSTLGATDDTIVCQSGNRYPGSSSSKASGAVVLTNTTTVTATRSDRGSDTVDSDYGWQVFEFADGPSVSRGTFSFPGTDTSETTSTFSPTLDPDLSTIVRTIGYAGGDGTYEPSGGSNEEDYKVMMAPDITTEIDTLTGTRVGPTSSVDAPWQIIEWPSAGGGGGGIPIFIDHARRRHSALPWWLLPVLWVGAGLMSKVAHNRRNFFKRLIGVQDD